MIEAGVLRDHGVSEAYGLHLWSPYPVGTIQVRPGATMAAQDEFEATVHGKGGHGALPHAAIDPIVAAAQAVVALQAVVARPSIRSEPAVVTVGLVPRGERGEHHPGRGRPSWNVAQLRRGRAEDAARGRAAGPREHRRRRMAAAATSSFTRGIRRWSTTPTRPSACAGMPRTSWGRRG
jgi:hypothetical protein